MTAERRISCPSLTASPKAWLRIESINGATIIAPITTAVLLEINPRDFGFQIDRPVAGERIGEAQDRVGRRHGTLAELWRQT